MTKSTLDYRPPEPHDIGWGDATLIVLGWWLNPFRTGTVLDHRSAKVRRVAFLSILAALLSFVCLGFVVALT